MNKLDLLRHKVYSSVNLHFCITNYQVILAKYNLFFYSKLAEFQPYLPVD